MDDAAVVAGVQEAIAAERAGLDVLLAGVPAQAGAVAAVCRLLVARTGEGRAGRAVCSGVGKAGLVARKVAATLSSTGTPSAFLHPTEALHGDLGAVGEGDVVLMFSNSGGSRELLDVVPALRRCGPALVALSAGLDTPLARLCDHALAIGRIAEACPLGLAPSASTTALLALGDALAMAALRLRCFTPEQYARYHPAGALGRRLMTCAEAMRPLAAVAVVAPEASLAESLRAITGARVGSAMLVAPDGALLGIFTDGDLRRALTRAGDPAAALGAAVAGFATMPCLSIGVERLVEEAIRLCAARRINELPVVDAAGRATGLIDLQDLAQRGFSVG